MLLSACLLLLLLFPAIYQGMQVQRMGRHADAGVRTRKAAGLGGTRQQRMEHPPLEALPGRQGEGVAHNSCQRSAEYQSFLHISEWLVGH